MKRLFSLLILGFTTACSTPPLPSLPATHPANTQAPTDAERPPFSGLREDEATRTTKKLLSTSDSTASEALKKTPETMQHSDGMMPMEHSGMSH